MRLLTVCTCCQSPCSIIEWARSREMSRQRGTGDTHPDLGCSLHCTLHGTASCILQQTLHGTSLSSEHGTVLGRTFTRYITLHMAALYMVHLHGPSHCLWSHFTWYVYTVHHIAYGRTLHGTFTRYITLHMVALYTVHLHGT